VDDSEARKSGTLQAAASGKRRGGVGISQIAVRKQNLVSTSTRPPSHDLRARNGTWSSSCFLTPPREPSSPSYSIARPLGTSPVRPGHAQDILGMTPKIRTRRAISTKATTHGSPAPLRSTSLPVGDGRPLTPPVSTSNPTHASRSESLPSPYSSGPLTSTSTLCATSSSPTVEFAPFNSW
jgi:hypothetical protein